jgi:hypothetical protein
MTIDVALQRRVLRAAAATIVCAACVLAVGCPAAAAGAASALVPTAGDLAGAGLHPGAASLTAGAIALDTGLTRTQARLVLRARNGAAAGSAGRERLVAGAFVFGSARVAHQILVAFKRVRHASRLHLGLDGAIAIKHVGRGEQFTLAWREGARVAVVQARFAGSGGTAAIASELAPVADDRLRSVLPTTAYDKVLAQIRPDGTVSKQTALQAFALTYGSLPGVDPPTGTRTRVPSGTLAAGWAIEYLNDLSPALKTAVFKRLGVTGVAGAGAAHDASYGDPGFVPSTSLTAEASIWAHQESAHLPGQPKLGLTIVAGASPNVTEVDKDGDQALADALPVNAAGALDDAGPYCRIRVNVEALTSNEKLQQTLAHEVFHCFEFFLTPTVWYKVGAWVREGMAEWVASTVTGFDDEWLLQYVKTAEAPLLQRSYSATGFWGHVQDVDGDLWSKIPQILATVSGPAEFVLAGGDQPQVLSTWASSQLRPGNSGPEWEMFSPIRPPDGAALPVDRIQDTVEDLPVQVDPFSTENVEIQPQDGEPLLQVTVDGSERLSDEHNYTDLSNAYFCMEQKCECPPGSPGSVPDSQPLESGADLALSAGSTAVHAELVFHDLAEYCNPKGVTMTEYQKASCIGCTAPTSLLGDLTTPATCTVDASGQLTITLSGSGTLRITAPAYRSLPKRSDGATVISFYAPRGSGADAVYGGWSTGDWIGPGSGAPPMPFGSAIVHKGGKDGVIAATMFNPGVSEASLLAAGDFQCKHAIK